MPRTNASHAHVARWFFLLLATGVAALFWRVISPYAITLVTAAIAAIMLAPVEARVRRVLRRPHLSALAMVALTLFLVVGPLATVATVMADQAVDIVSSTVGDPEWVAGVRLERQAAVELLPEFARKAAQSVDVVGVLRGAAQWVTSNLGALAKGTATFVLNTFIFFVALYYFLLDRERIAREMAELSPLRDRVDHDIARRMVETVRGVILGSLIVAAVQGVLAGIGLTIFGVPGALLWAGLVVVAAQIPMLGTSVVMLPCVAYLLLTGHQNAGVALLVWSVVVVSMVDNVLKPYVVGGRTRMHGLLILVSMLGGLQAFGPIGFILGPTILAAFLVMVELYKAGILEKDGAA